MADTAVEIFVENLERLICCSNLDFIMQEKEQLQSLHNELVFLADFLKNTEEKQDEHSKVKNLIRDVAHRAEIIVDRFTVEAFKHKKRILASKPGSFLELGDVRKEIGAITAELEIYVKKMHEIEIPKDVAESSSVGSSRQINVAAKLKENMAVGFDDEAKTIIHELDGRTQKKLNIISIVGAPGAGKTTLARKVYNDRRIQECFDIRGWIVVSQVYDKKDLLIGILKSTFLIIDGDYELSYDQLGEQLHKRLRNKKYLIVIDDIWSVEAWRDIERSFPDDGRGSRVMFTTRLLEVGEIAHHHHDLLPLSPGDSWDLLRRQVFGEQNCPSVFLQTGMKVADKCRGLPLAIVVIAGILKETLTLPWWKQVVGSLSSIIATNDEVCMNTLALSYNHLPLHLKACFLYLGAAFREDYEIPVNKLILLWIAEGFVKQSGEKTLEAITEGYLMDLVGRSLVMVAKKRPGGGINACRIHDLLRELCLMKAKEEYFFWHRHFRCSSGELNITNIPPNLRTLLCQHPYSHECGGGLLNMENIANVSSKLNLLSVLDLSAARRRALRSYLDEFPAEVVNFVHLRYLAIASCTIRLPPSISNLWNLETLILYTTTDQGTVNLPEMGNTTRLRHIRVKSCVKNGGRIHFENPCKPFSSWDNLQTLDGLCPCEGCLTFLKTTRNLKKLRICWAIEDGGLLPIEGCLTFLKTTCNLIKMGFCWAKEVGGLMFRDTPFSEKLEELKLIDNWSICRYNIHQLNQVFPLSIRKLTLRGTNLHWEDMTILGQLPYLEVLKLFRGAFVEGIWNTNDDEFCRLKYLLISEVDVSEWNSCADHFPNLETLVVELLYRLTVFPSDFAELTSLEKILVDRCKSNVVDFARQIKEEHFNYHGDYRLEVIISHLRKVVLKIDLHDDKAKQKTMKAVSSLQGMESIAMDMKEKKLTVIGDVDVVGKLRKLGHSTEILSVVSIT